MVLRRRLLGGFFRIGSIRTAIWAVYLRRVRKSVLGVIQMAPSMSSISHCLVVTIKNKVEAQHHFGVPVDIIDLNQVSDKRN